MASPQLWVYVPVTCVSNIYVSLSSTPQPEQYSLIIRREKRLGAKKVCTIVLDYNMVKCPIVLCVLFDHSHLTISDHSLLTIHLYYCCV